MTRELDIAGGFSITAKYPDGMFLRPDVSVYVPSVGPRTEELLTRSPELTDSLSTFRSLGNDESKKAVLLLTGIVPSANITYSKQQGVLLDSGYQPVLVDYSPSDFKVEALRAQLADFINSPGMDGKEVSLVGVSFGTTCIIDFLSTADPDDISRVRNAVLLGTIHSLDDIQDPAVKKLARISMRFAPEFLKKGLMPVAKKAFNMDPLYLEEFGEEGIKHDLAATSVNTLVNKLNAIAANSGSRDLPRVSEVDALFINWSWDYSSLESLQEERDMFGSSEHVIVPGRHGQTASSAEEINRHMLAFLETGHIAA